MPTSPFKTRTELDAMVDEIGLKLETLYRASDGAPRAETWAALTSAVLKLAAPEDQEYVYERLYAVFKAHPSDTAQPQD